MSISIEELYNELNNKCSKMEDQLFEMSKKVIPMYRVGDILVCVDKDKKTCSLTVDEIIITKLGVSYREYLSETEFKQFPEFRCFSCEGDAMCFIQQLNKTESEEGAAN